MGLRTLTVMGPWVRLHRAESDVLAALLSAEERDAVNRRLGRPTSKVPAWLPPSMGDQGGRFAEPHGPGALYLGNTLETCVAEVIHHHGLHCMASVGTPPGTRAVLRHLLFQVAGDFADASLDRRGGLHNPEDYAASWGFGRKVRQAGLPGVHYRSVRKRGGRCLAVFNGQVARFLRHELGAVILEWDGMRSRRIL
ncbi:RES family NAD+ phosphorylase [Holophaga foetida]|uniref:RES family NAD+ phosphorylase n=1 Tax=Holophaga foetida TaxID=35839 RepID=UPI0002473AE7|nr:RES family NAD+ phosphorylase [Holophaga foetida]